MKKFISRKLLAFILVPILMAVNAKIGNPLDPSAVEQLVMAALAYILGQAAVDTAHALKGKD